MFKNRNFWLGILIARAAADTRDATAWMNQLAERFPDSREAIASQQGRFDDSSLLPR